MSVVWALQMPMHKKINLSLIMSVGILLVRNLPLINILSKTETETHADKPTLLARLSAEPSKLRSCPQNQQDRISLVCYLVLDLFQNLLRLTCLKGTLSLFSFGTGNAIHPPTHHLRSFHIDLYSSIIYADLIHDTVWKLTSSSWPHASPRYVPFI